jgi:hypothetical protein
MTSNKRTIWETYADAWAAAGPAEKAAALQQSCESGCIYRDPQQRADGHDSLIQVMLAFHQQVPGGNFVTTHFQEHHDRSLAKWTMHDADGKLLGDGISFGEYSPEGKLLTMTGFF